MIFKGRSSNLSVIASQCHLPYLGEAKRRG
nr:MAG TPA: hypothetical protein [Caudoviricetes sp.]